MTPHTNDKLHLGCGLTAPPTWLNVDGSWGARLAKYPLIKKCLAAVGVVKKHQDEISWSRDIVIADLTKPLRFPTGRFTAVYASHTLEHLYLDQADALLRESFRVLKPGGVARFVVPDVFAILEEYYGRQNLEGIYYPAADKSRADRLNMRLLMHPWNAPRGNFLWRAYNAAMNFHDHKWMYDTDSLADHMRAAGFVNVQPRGYLESAIPDLADVERRERVERGVGAVCEGVKPS